jgi:DNA polymerase V
MFVHIDCNSYFASCEIATNRELEGKPVIVANDNEAGGGIVLALNAEAKALGLKRGDPVFKVKNIIKLNGVQLCHADHKKYHHISAAIMNAVQQQGLVLDFVQYSVDEFFGSMPLNDADELRHYVGLVKQLIWDKMHIPVSCGCAQTYTLAKAATHFAKHYQGYNGICVLTPEKREQALGLLPIADVWGVGRQNRMKLESMGVRTALDFVRVDEKVLRNAFGISGLRTWHELQGQPCLNLERPALQKSIMQSRTFAFMISSKEELAKEIKTFAQSCCVSLRAQKAMTESVSLFVTTNRHREDLEQYSNSAGMKFRSPTDDTGQVIKAALQLLDVIFREGYKYKQAGVVLNDITQVEGSQLDLFAAENNERRHKLMQVTDAINHKFGNDAISFSMTKKDFQDINAPLTYPNDENK